MTEITAIDVTAKLVRGGATAVPYDVLIVATGAKHSYFGHEEWSGHAPALKSISDATMLRERLLAAFEQAELAKVTGGDPAAITIAIVGGGPTGVEMAGAVAELAHKILAGDFRGIDPGRAHIVLIEAGPRLLPSFTEDLSIVARRSLEAMGIEVRTDTAVTGFDDKAVILGAGDRLDATAIVWAAGVTASPAASWLGAAHDRAGRVAVAADLSLPSHPEIFVIGDTAAIADERGPVPGVAPAAKQMGSYVGKVIVARLRNRAAPPPFRYRDEGSLATIGRKSAVVALGRLRFKGFLGWLFWSAVHIWFLIGFRSRVVVSFNWLWSYLTYQRGARLITGDPDS
jgi:NADH dehydrogenase